MGPSRLIQLERVWRMLDECLPGYERRATDHHHRITAPDGRIYPSLPLGAHGRRQNAEIQVGHVRSMARFFEIEECARRVLAEAFS